MASKVIAFCGSTTRIRNEVITRLMETVPGLSRHSVPTSIRAPWRRYPALEVLLRTTPGVMICEIHSREESELVGAYGGTVIHVEGIPSADVPINREDLLITRDRIGRGRYLTIPETVKKLALADA